MKKAHLGLLVLLMMVGTFVKAQHSAKISGMAVEGATISLLKSSDSSVVKLAIAGTQGSFEMDRIAYGIYRLSVSAIGYQAYLSPSFELTEINFEKQFHEIALQPESKEMGAVTVTAAKRMIEVKPDRTIVNVDAAISNAGATAMEVLEKSPGVSVDRDGNVSLRGRQGTMVMIDGKPSYLSGADLANLLNNMSANQIDQIEIMTNPPAKYDAAGNAGIINIKTKKSKQRGWNGNLNLSYGQGRYYKTNNSLNLNYRNEKFNAFLNYSQNANAGFNNLLIKRTYLDAAGNTTAFFDQPTYLVMQGNNNNLKLGIDYNLTKKTTVGITGTGFVSPRKFSGISSGYLRNAMGQTDSLVITTSDNSNRWLNGTLNISLRSQLDKNTEFSADLDYVRYDMGNNQLFTTNTYEGEDAFITREQLKGDLPATISIYAAKADYTQSLESGLKLESGIKASHVKTDNTANYYNSSNNGWEPDYEKTNHFLYEENISAAYGNASKTFGKWSLQAGLRLENTQYKGRQLGNPEKADSSFRRSYTSLFPTSYITYKADSNHTFTVNAGRRIDRPAYQQLNPFLFFINKYTYQVGNPYLQPQFTWTYGISHTYKDWLTTSITHSNTSQYSNQIFRTEGEITILTQGNIAKMQNTDLTVTVQLKPTSWWSANLSATGSHRRVRGLAANSDFNSEAISGNASLNNNFKFSKGWSAELSGNYNTAFEDAQFRIYDFGQVSAGIAKNILKGKGTLKMNVRDIFFSQTIVGDIKYQNVRERFRQNRDSRIGTLSFTWRFGKNFSDNKPRRNNSSSNDEQRRVGAGA